MLASTSTGHLGPTLSRSSDFGRTWKEATSPPAFPRASEGHKGRAVSHTFWLAPGHAGERSEIEARGGTLAELLADLDRRYPGIRFRMLDEQDEIRRHMRIWVNAVEVRTLDVPLRAADEVIIVQALSGG